METVLARRTIALLLSLGFLLVAGGFVLLGWVAHSTLNPGPAPYRFQLVNETVAARSARLGVEAWPDLKIEKYGCEFSDAPPRAEKQRKFRPFPDTLSVNAATDTAALRDRVGERETYVVADVAEPYKRGLIHPERLGAASNSFPIKGDMHGQIAVVQGWMRDITYTACGLEKLSESQLRAYVLTDARSSDALLAQILPLITSKPTELKALQLVYQHVEYWAYRLRPPIRPAD